MCGFTVRIVDEISCNHSQAYDFTLSADCVHAHQHVFDDVFTCTQCLECLAALLAVNANTRDKLLSAATSVRGQRIAALFALLQSALHRPTPQVGVTCCSA